MNIYLKRIFCPKIKVSFQFLECDDDEAVQNHDVNLEEVEQQHEQNKGEEISSIVQSLKLERNL